MVHVGGSGRAVSPYRNRCHHTVMKGDHPPIFGFRADAGNNNNGRGPPMDGSVLKASKGAAELHIIRPQNKPSKQ